MNISVDLGGSHIDIGIVSEDFKIDLVSSVDIDSNFRFGDFIYILFDILEKRGFFVIDKLSFALPGTVDPYRNYCINCPNLKYWKGLDFNSLYQKFRERGIYIKKIVVSNDCNAGAVGAYKVLKLKEKNIVYIAVGTGIGAGAVINGRLLIGSNFSAMEVGHTKIDKKSYRCGCGALSCIETFASAKALTNYYNQFYKTTHKNLLSVIEKENAFRVKRLFKRFSKYLSTLINNVIYLIDPDFIFLSGKIVLSSEIFEIFLFNDVIAKVTMIEGYDLSRIVFLKEVENYNTYNLVGAVWADEFM
ncbi:MAG: ROK family protein [bacterium]|nr:ROK family protein [bacterium]